MISKFIIDSTVATICQQHGNYLVALIKRTVIVQTGLYISTAVGSMGFKSIADSLVYIIFITGLISAGIASACHISIRSFNRHESGIHRIFAITILIRIQFTVDTATFGSVIRKHNFRFQSFGEESHVQIHGIATIQICIFIIQISGAAQFAEDIITIDVVPIKHSVRVLQDILFILRM